MGRFKEYNNNTFYIGPDGTGVTNTGEEKYNVLYTRYATYPYDTNNNDLVWFGLKQGDNFEGVLSQNIDYSNGFNFTSSHSDCWAKIGPNNPAWSPDRKTGMEPYFFIGKSDVYREITFKWKDFVVFKFIQYGTPTKLLICKPTWYGNDNSHNTVIGFSTSETTISNRAFRGHGGTGIDKCLCTISTDPSYTRWHNMQIKTLSLKYIKGTNLKNLYPDYWLTDMVVDNNGTIIEGDFDKIKALRFLYIFTQSSSGPQKIGYVIMEEQGEYMLAEIG